MEPHLTEAAARRLARKYDLCLRKSRVRCRDDPSFGGYMLVTLYTNCVVLGADAWAFSATLQDVSDYLTA